MYVCVCVFVCVSVCTFMLHRIECGTVSHSSMSPSSSKQLLMKQAMATREEGG